MTGRTNHNKAAKPAQFWMFLAATENVMAVRLEHERGFPLFPMPFVRLGVFPQELARLADQFTAGASIFTAFVGHDSVDDFRLSFRWLAFDVGSLHGFPILYSLTFSHKRRARS